MRAKGVTDINVWKTGRTDFAVVVVLNWEVLLSKCIVKVYSKRNNTSVAGAFQKQVRKKQPALVHYPNVSQGQKLSSNDGR